MRIAIAAVGARPRMAFEELARLYLDRMAAYLPAGGGRPAVEAPVYRSEEALWEAVERERSRPLVVLLDERGKQMGSEAFASWLGRERDGGRAMVLFAVGPADGWRRSAEPGAQTTGKRGAAGEAVWLSLGPMTMAHELARVVLCEQVYRALTILAGHPYHRGSG